MLLKIAETRSMFRRSDSFILVVLTFYDADFRDLSENRTHFPASDTRHVTRREHA
jgi:hypothetical protein